MVSSAYGTTARQAHHCYIQFQILKTRTAGDIATTPHSEGRQPSLDQLRFDKPRSVRKINFPGDNNDVGWNCALS